MKALKSKLAHELLSNRMQIPLKNGSKLTHFGKQYTVQFVPKAGTAAKNR